MKKISMSVFVILLGLVSLFSFGSYSSAAIANNESNDIEINTLSCHGTGLAVAGANVRTGPSTKYPVAYRLGSPKYYSGWTVKGAYVNGNYGGSDIWVKIPISSGYRYISLTMMSFECDRN